MVVRWIYYLPYTPVNSIGYYSCFLLCRTLFFFLMHSLTHSRSRLLSRCVLAPAAQPPSFPHDSLCRPALPRCTALLHCPVITAPAIMSHFVGHTVQHSLLSFLSARP